MELAKKIRLLFLLFVASVLIMAGCSEKEDLENKRYQKPPDEKLDSLTTYFAEVENFTHKNYLPQFYTSFNKKLNVHQWQAAARILSYAGQVVCTNNLSDSLLLHTHIDFINKHATDISNRYQSGIYNNISNLYYYAANPKNAIIYLKKAIAVPPTDYYTLLNIADAYKYLCYDYAEAGQLDSALTSGFKGLDIAIKLKDTLGIGANYDAIAAIYATMDDDKNAEIFYKKAMDALKTMNDDRGVFAVYLNQLSLLDKNNDKQLLPQIDSMYRFYQTSNFINNSYTIYANGWYAYKLVKENRLPEAKKILEVTRPLFECSEENFLFDTYFMATTLYDKKTGSRTLDKSYYLAVIPKYKKDKVYQTLLACYDALTEEAIGRNDYKTAFFFKEEYEKTMDSLANSELKKKVKELDKKYQTEKKEQEIAIQKKEIAQKNTFIYALSTSLVGLLLATLAFYLWQKQKKLTQEKTNSMNFTKQLLESTEVERKRIASDLHDSISHDLLSLKTSFSQDFSLVNGKIDAIINDIRIISRNLHPVMFDKIGLQPNIESLVERIQTQNDFLVVSDIHYNGSLSSADELQIYRIIQEALNNIIKYANAHAAKITILEENDKIKIEIKDNGKGFNVKETLNGGKAFGLHNIIERSRVIGGIATIQSTPNGTVISIAILTPKL